jgi:hypothetical protein
MSFLLSIFRRLHNNPLECDCDITWLVNLVQEKDSELQLSASCASPENLAKRQLTSLTGDDITCGEYLTKLQLENVQQI